jgi:hypothetical protein
MPRWCTEGGPFEAVKHRLCCLADSPRIAVRDGSRPLLGLLRSHEVACFSVCCHGQLHLCRGTCGPMARLRMLLVTSSILPRTLRLAATNAFLQKIIPSSRYRKNGPAPPHLSPTAFLLLSPTAAHFIFLPGGGGGNAASGMGNGGSTSLLPCLKR